MQALRKLDQEPDDDILGQVAGAIHRADDRIAELVEEDPALNGTSTTATVALFDGTRVAVGHIGDSRAYLFRRGELRQLTHDHTFVQTPDRRGPDHRGAVADPPAPQPHPQGARRHPHEEPDLFEFARRAGDRLFLCSDGACGFLPTTGWPTSSAAAPPTSPRSSSSEPASRPAAATTSPASSPRSSRRRRPSDLEPLLVGAAADLPRRLPLGGAVGGLFRGHRSGDTGEIPAVPDDVPEGAYVADPIDPEAARYAPRDPGRYAWLRRLLVAAVLLGLGWVVLAAGWSWSQQQFYVAEDDGKVAIFRGIDASLPGV